MRITNNTIIRGYNRNLKRLAEDKFTSEKRIYTGRQYWRASESPLQAAKALTIRKQLYDTAQYRENLQVADKFYTEAETSMLQISDKLASVRETLIYGCNSTKDVSVDLNILAQQLVTDATEMIEIFNTDSAERVIFGGESNNAQPFSFRLDDNGNPIELLYHGVPVNALSKAKQFPYSNDVFIDIGIGMNMNQDTQYVDPQSVLKISFNGAEVTGCGYEKSSAGLGYINMHSLKSEGTNELLFTFNGETKLVQFEGNKPTSIRDAIAETFGVDAGEAGITINSSGAIGVGEPNTLSLANDTYLKLDQMVPNKEYSIDLYINGERSTVTFRGGVDAAETMDNFNAACEKVFEFTGLTVSIDDVSSGVISVTNRNGDNVPFYIGPSHDGTAPSYGVEQGFSNNYIQLTLDAARALREGDLEYANACIDRIVSSSENLLVEIANLGSAEDFIEFNTDRLDTREMNLLERQKAVEASDPEYEITLWKTYQAIYNACLQMSSSIVPNSIFNYIS